MDHQHSSILSSALLSEKTPLQRIYRGLQSTGEPIFIKQCTAHDLNTASGTLLSEEQHFFIMKGPHVVQWLGHHFEKVAGSEDYRFSLYLEWMETSLEKEIERGRKWSEYELWSCLKALIEVLTLGQLQHQFAHRNITPKSIFFKGDIVKLGSFGYSVAGLSDPLMSELSLSKQAITMESGLFERFLREKIANEGKLPYNMHKADVYSLGLALLMMSKSGKLHRNEDIRAEIAKLPFSKEWKGTLGLMLQENEAIRPDFLQLSAILCEVRPDFERISSISTRPSSRITGSRPSAIRPVDYAEKWLSELAAKPEDSLRKLFLFNQRLVVTVSINLRCHHCRQIYRISLLTPYSFTDLLFCTNDCLHFYTIQPS